MSEANDNPTASDRQAAALGRRQLLLVFAGLLLAVLLAALDQTIVATALPTIVGELIAPRERGRYIGAFFGMFGLASVAGPLLGGYLTDAWSWRWCF